MVVEPLRALAEEHISVRLLHPELVPLFAVEGNGVSFLRSCEGEDVCDSPVAEPYLAGSLEGALLPGGDYTGIAFDFY